MRQRAFQKAAIAAVLTLCACASPRPGVTEIAVTPEVVERSTRFRKEYVLAPGDQIEVAVRRSPEISRTVVIRPDGFISLPVIDQVRAAGLTPQELDRELTELLASRLIDPDVTIIATQVRVPVVYVLGDVNANAAIVPLREAPTAIQAIAAAGGLRRSAAARDITLIRLGEDGYLRAAAMNDLALGIAPTPTADRGNAPTNRFARRPAAAQTDPYVLLRRTLLQADDIVFVPENGRSQVSRALDDFVNRPLSAFNQLFGLYVNYRLVQELRGQ